MKVEVFSILHIFPMFYMLCTRFHVGHHFKLLIESLFLFVDFILYSTTQKNEVALKVYLQVKFKLLHENFIFERFQQLHCLKQKTFKLKTKTQFVTFITKFVITIFVVISGYWEHYLNRVNNPIFLSWFSES